MKKKLILLVASLAILVANFAILPVSAATKEEIVVPNDNIIVEEIYFNKLTIGKVDSLLETITYQDGAYNPLLDGAPFYIIFCGSPTLDTSQLTYIPWAFAIIDIGDGYVIVNYTEEKLLFCSSENYARSMKINLGWQEEPLEYYVNQNAYGNVNFTSNISIQVGYDNEKLFDLVYTIGIKESDKPNIFELVFNFIYNEILGGESDIYDSSQLALFLTIFVIILIVFALLSIIRSVFNWFRWRK